MTRARPPAVLRRRVRSARNSLAGSWRLDGLDFSTWYSDGGTADQVFGVGSGAHIYLHVPVDPASYADGLMDHTVHRVYPRRIKGYVCRRLAMHNGELCWLYDRERE